ncbi:MAG: large exoprotein [Microbacterium sp.]
MGGQVLGGGVVIAVVAALWLVYLLPTWFARMRFDAAERNAVRLNQALRVLAETSETPDEIRLELSARDAREQQKLVRRMREEEQKLRARERQVELDRRRREVEEELRGEREQAALEAERRRLEREREAQRLRQIALDLRLDPNVLEARQRRARRATRLAATILTVVGLALIGVGVWRALVAGSPWWLVGGMVAVIVGVQVLRRMAAVSRRSERRMAEPIEVRVAEPVRRVEPVLLNAEDRGWTPRALPAPLSQTPGSRAAAVLAQADARQSLRTAALAEAMREQAERSVPAPVPFAPSAPAANDDAAIEAHVRELLASRAAS